MKKLLVNLIMLILISIPTSVFAVSSLTIACDENNVAGQTLTCNLTVEVEDVQFNKIEGTINLGEGTTSFEAINGITGNINNNKLIITSTKEITSGTLGKINIKFNENTTGTQKVELANLKFYNDSEEVLGLDSVNDSVLVKSDVKTLQSLTVENCNACKLSPNFKSSLTIYSITTTEDEIVFNAIPNGNATVSGDGTKKLTKDKETFEIVVTSEAGNTKKYKIIVNKEKAKSSDNSLKSLTIDNGTLKPSFASDVTSYTVTIDKEEITINAVANDDNAKISGTGKQKLDYGKNDFNIVVTAEDGTSKNYLLEITRPDTRNANAYLKDLTINGKNIGFEKDITEYNYTLEEDLTNIEIDALPELETSVVNITGNNNLVVGKNEIIILVTAEDESTKEYKITVNKIKQKETEEIYLQGLDIQGYNIDFIENKFEYNIVIKDEKKLIINVVSKNENDTIEIIGNEDLKNGSIIKVIVTNEDGDSNIYKIKIATTSEVHEIDKKVESDINYIPIIMTSLLVLLVILNIIQIIKRSRQK